jgi:hypothetical protein
MIYNVHWVNNISLTFRPRNAISGHPGIARVLTGSDQERVDNTSKQFGPAPWLGKNNFVEAT